MSASTSLVGPRALDDPLAIRAAGRGLLSLALLDARNHLLQRLALDESPAALRLAAAAGAYQEQWVTCHVQRGRGEECDAGAVRLAGLEPALAGWLDESAPPPSAGQVRDFLGRTLELTLDLLAATPQEDRTLHYFRQSLLHEDRLCEALDERLHVLAPPARVQREALWMPARRWLLGTPPGGLVPANERWAHEVTLPEFEIDAQAVNWAQFVEFALDGGYERAELWSPPGWQWVQATGRSAPSQVAQWRGGVLVNRGLGPSATVQRAPAGQAVMHVSRHEAQAWCAWAGRRLPTEPEWELAASTGASRGFVWGDVFEWVAGSARLWPNAPAAAPGAIDRPPASGAGVLRGASCATRLRWHHAKARRWAQPESDRAFCGFRSCAL